MDIDLQKLLKENPLLKYEFSKGNFGMEKEGLRTKMEDDSLALTDHPHTLGNRSYHPYIQTDFSESQPELVTPVLSSVDQLYDWLIALSDVLNQSMAPDEYIWPFSMPNELPEENEIPIIRVENQEDIKYREYLAQKYSRKLQLITGIHYNFSFVDDFIGDLFELQETFETETELKNYLHLKLASNFLRYEWLLLYLYGAAPYALPSFFEEASEHIETPEDYSRSIRNGEYGYHNDDQLIVRYDSLETYVNDIACAVESGQLSHVREFYGNARLRGGESLEELVEDGIEYIEFRSFDLNPYAEVGMTKEQLAFIHLFFLAMVWIPEIADQTSIELGQEMMMETATASPLAKVINSEEAARILDVMTEIQKELHLPEIYVQALQAAKDAVGNPEKTLAGQVVQDLEKMSYKELGHQLGMEHHREATEKPYRLRGFEEFELSTQLLIFDSMQLGVEVEVLDASDQFIRLTHGDHVEYVRKGNMTSHDTTISHFIMENKTVTKRVLADAGYQVPGGEEFRSVEQAIEGFQAFANQPLVVKPKTTNYGWGISVFVEPPKQSAYEEAVKIAFDFDDAILVEDYAKGTEYRFFVLNGETKAVLLRVPANVIGDGTSTISELIDQKNKNPLRGENHQTPMGKLEKGKVERLMLHEQGLTFDSVLEKGQRVYLRENSNISTGGDSIDMTDQVHPSYKKVAEGIAAAIDVEVTGVDLIIPDINLPSTKEHPGYTCLEANFNPAMNMHAFVTQGEGRRLTRDILRMLYPELMNETYWLPYEQVYGKND